MSRENVTSGLPSRLVVTGLVCWAVAGTAFAVLRLTFGDRPVSVDVRFAATVDDATRIQLEQRYRLAQPEPNGEQTFSYALTDRSRENVRNLVVDPAVEDTNNIDRPASRVESSAPWLPYVTPNPHIPVGLEYLSVLGFLGGLAGIGLALIKRSPTLVRWIGVLDRLLARKQGLIRSSLIGLILLLPALSLTGMASVYLGQRLADFHPDDTDAILYWHQIKTFVVAGFSGGYYTIGEVPAAAGFTHFFAHGPWYVALYGLIGKAVGWNLWSPMLFDVAAVTLALLGGLLLMRPNSRQLLLALLVLLTYWPLHLYLPVAMQEPFHYAVAIMLAGIFYRLLIHEGAVPHPLLGAALIIILGAALARPTWALLLLPLVMIVVEKRPHGLVPRGSRFRQVLRYWPLLPACAVVAGIALQFVYVAAPYPHRLVSDIERLLRSPVDGLQSLVAISTAQGMAYLWPDVENPLWTLLRYQALVIVLWMTVLTIRRRSTDAGQRAPGHTPWRRAERLTHILNLSPLFLLVVVLYDVGLWVDYRVVAPHLLLSLLLLAVCGRTRVVAVMVLAGLLLTPSFLAAYKDLAPRQFTDEQARFDVFAAQTAGTLEYEAQDDPWCNTVLLQLQNAIVLDLLAIPAGFGTSFGLDLTSGSELKSRYVIVDDESREGMTEAFDLQFVSATALGDLYRNVGRSCTE